jgi:hypothetical protein
MKVVDLKDGQIKEVKAEVDAKSKAIAEKNAEISKISDAAKRKINRKV